MKPYINVEYINKNKPERCKLTAIEEVDKRILNSGKNLRMFLFKCVCGVTKKHKPQAILSGDILTCGCGQKKYNLINKKIKGVYYAMINRCYNPLDFYYNNYGGRGVLVCDEWKTNPQSFFDWCAISGYKEGLSLDKDIKGSGFLYSPDDCMWVTHQENCKKTRRTRIVVYEGVEMILSDFSRLTGIPLETLRHRMDKIGLSPEEAVKWVRNKRKKETF